MAVLEGKTAIITGAARGIGQGIALAMASKGASVVLTDRLADLGEAAAGDLREQGYNAQFIPHDVTSESDWNSVFQKTLELHGSVEVLVNNAGVAPPVDIESATSEEFRQVLEINLMGTFTGLQLAIKHMKENGGGSIVNVASNSTAGVTQATGIYSPSKAAVANLTKVAALHCAREGLNIRVNSVHPGPCDTHMLTGEFSEEVLQMVVAASPMQRLGKPIEIGYVVAFLASDEASFVTGAEYFADGAVTVAQF